MRRQLSDSAVISTGRPERVNTKAISWSRVGPPRTLTRSGLRLTKRGTGRPLLGPLPISPAAWPTATKLIAAASMARAAVAKRRAVCELRFELICPRRWKGADRDTEAARGVSRRRLSSDVHLLQRVSVTEGPCYGRPCYGSTWPASEEGPVSGTVVK